MAARGVSAVLWAAVMVTVATPVFSKPFFDGLWCDLLCDDDDSTGTSTSAEDLFDSLFDPCGACAPRRPRPTTPGSAAGPPLNIMFGPSAMNLTMAPSNGSWVVTYLPIGAGLPGAAPPTPAAAAPAAPAAPASPPAGTPPAAGATTAKPGATTAAPPKKAR